MKIIHAVSDENERARGGIAGDQTGKEIREAKWYDRPWAQYIECKDTDLAAHAVTIIKAICAGNYGYNQDARWTGYDAICKYGIESGCGDFDCSSLVLSCYRLAGLSIKEKTGSTRDVAKILTATGKFKLSTDRADLSTADHARKGALFCTPGKHVCMCIEDGPNVEIPAPAGQQTVDRQLVRALGSVRIRETPKDGKTISIAHEGDVIEVYGTDEATGWYKTGTGFITKNERYVEVIKC